MWIVAAAVKSFDSVRVSARVSASCSSWGGGRGIRVAEERDSRQRWARR